MTTTKQQMVNENLEQVFEMSSTVGDKMKNIIKPEPVVTEKQSIKPKRAKAPSRGGKREGSGRPKGSTNKITPTEMLTDFQQKAGMNFYEFINEQIVSAHNAGDRELVSKYLLGFAKYLVQDVQEIKQDVTSNGQTIGANFSFPSVELPDWQNEQTTKH